MTDIEFFAVVAKMRQSQKKYFATRNNDPTKAEYLKESKRLEKIIDSEITQRLKSINAATLKEAYKRFAADYEPQQKLF